MNSEAYLQHACRLSICARMAIALIAFESWSKHIGLDHADLSDVFDHHWAFMGLSNPDDFQNWADAMPEMSGWGGPDKLTVSFALTVERLGLDRETMLQHLGDLAEILHTSMYAAANGPAVQLHFAATLHRIPVRHWPSTEPFESSKWDQKQGWGNATAAEAASWRTTNVTGPPT
jgi:hypothetical protein